MIQSQPDSKKIAEILDDTRQFMRHRLLELLYAGADSNTLYTLSLSLNTIENLSKPPHQLSFPMQFRTSSGEEVA